MFSYSVIRVTDGCQILAPVNELQDAINIALSCLSDSDAHYRVYSHERIGNLHLKREVYSTQSLFALIDSGRMGYNTLPRYAHCYN